MAILQIASSFNRIETTLPIHHNLFDQFNGNTAMLEQHENYYRASEASKNGNNSKDVNFPLYIFFVAKGWQRIKEKNMA